MAFKNIQKVSRHQHNWESKTVMRQINLRYLFPASIKMLGKCCKRTISMSWSSSVSTWAQEIPNHLKDQKMCNEAMLISLTWSFYLIPDPFKKQCMCIKEFEEHSWDPINVLDCFKIQEMCDDTVRRGNSCPMQCIPDFFVKQKQENILLTQWLLQWLWNY